MATYIVARGQLSQRYDLTNLTCIPKLKSSHWFQMSASNEGDDIEDVSDDQIIEVRRGKPVYMADNLKFSDEEEDGSPPLLVRE